MERKLFLGWETEWAQKEGLEGRRDTTERSTVVEEIDESDYQSRRVLVVSSRANPLKPKVKQLSCRGNWKMLNGDEENGNPWDDEKGNR